MQSHRSGHQLQLEGRHCCEGQAQVPDALILLGSNSAQSYRGSHCTATIPLVLLNSYSSTEGQEHHLLPILAEMGHLASPGTV